MVTSRAAAISKVLGVVAIAGFALGPAAANLGIASPIAGFGIFALGLLFALLALVSGAIGLFTTRGANSEGRGNAVVGILLALIPLTVAIGVAGPKSGVPRINDITTNTIDPPRFTAAVTDAANAGRDLDYPGESFASQQRAAYPDITTIQVDAPPDATFARALDAAEDLGWKLTYQDEAAGRFEAIDVTRLFHFVDDISVRVARKGAGSLVDIRSKSRDGQGDMGANAARIRAFREAIDGEFGS
jgi:hypothetical protein